MIPSGEVVVVPDAAVYQRGLVIDSQRRAVGNVFDDSISKGIGD